MTRREERQLLMELVYEFSFYTAGELQDIYTSEKELREIDSEYVDKCTDGVIENMDEIDKYISASSKGWKLSRLSRITLSIMRVAVYEMIFEKLHYSIAINEAVELAKKFDDDKAPAFINGVLNNIALTSGLKNDK